MVVLVGLERPGNLDIQMDLMHSYVTTCRQATQRFRVRVPRSR